MGKEQCKRKGQNLTPEPFRGRRNEPTYVKYVVEAIARLKKLDLDDVRNATVKNALRVFGLNT